MLPTLVRDTDESYRRQVYACWKYWQQQLAPDEVRQLLLLLDQPQDAPRSIKRFLDRFKQFAIARHIDESLLHLSSRVSRNGWTYGPSFEFLEWLAQTPVSHVGAVPRFAVLRWALGEDADLWLSPSEDMSVTLPPVCGVAAMPGTTPLGPPVGRCATLAPDNIRVSPLPCQMRC